MNARTLPKDATARKQYPVATGVLDYFPDAIVALAQLSYQGNEQHNPGQSLHWAREKSKDHPDTLLRHFLERGSVDTDGMRHSAKMAWRALAILQLEIEAELEIKKAHKDDAAAYLRFTRYASLFPSVMERRTGLSERRMSSYKYSYGVHPTYQGPYRRLSVGKCTQIWGRRSTDRMPK